MKRPKYPFAPRQDIAEEIHGHRVLDPYRWLEGTQNIEREKWLEAQDALFRGAMAETAGRDRLRDRIAELNDGGHVGMPVWRGDRRFFLRRRSGQEHSVLHTVGPGSDAERVLIDPMSLDATGSTTLDSWEPDKEGRLLAYQVSAGGREESQLYVMDVATGARIEGPIDRCRYSPVAWLPGGAAFYYVRRLPASAVPEGESEFHRRVYLHRVGTSPDADLPILGAGMDKTNDYDISMSGDGRWLILSASPGTATRTDLWIADLTAAAPAAPALAVVQEGVDADAVVHVGRDGRAYVLTDRDAPPVRLCVFDPAAPSYETWHELIPEDPQAVLTDFAILDGPELERAVLLAGWTRHAISEISVHDLATGERVGVVDTPGYGTIRGIVERPEGGHEAWFAYSDNVTPTLVRRYDARTGETSRWAAPDSMAVPVVTAPDVRTRLIAYQSKDGTRAHMLVVAGSEGRDRPRPTILYGYGGFGISLRPSYSASLLAWVEAGGVYAIANLRGGGEEGEDWHRAGMLGNKQNVFDDFHAAAETLIEQGWTTSDRLAIFGVSNGGLLVGAALTQRPELYRAAVCAAPLLDMVRYERFGLGQAWQAEYGSAEDPEQFEWLLSYSPYHHVREAVEYPATMFTIFAQDARVDPLHAYKMCAALQHATGSDRPILLRVEPELGHGPRAASRSIANAADILSFLAAQTGLELGSAPASAPAPAPAPAAGPAAGPAAAEGPERASAPGRGAGW